MRPFQLLTRWLSFWARLVLAVRQPLVVGITGSAGKTTTKEMIAAVLMAPDVVALRGPAGKTRGNANGVRGLPLAILQLPMWWNTRGLLLTAVRAPIAAAGCLLARRYPKTLVLEYGIMAPGQLSRMTRLARPHIAAVTTIGPSHLDRLKTVDAVAHEKGFLVAAAPEHGLVVLGGGHPYVGSLAARSRAPVIVVEGKGVEASKNIARAVAAHLGVPADLAETVLAGDFTQAGRQNRIEANGMTIIDDAYNANPVSMLHGLETLAASTGCVRKVAILGPMAELGTEWADYHRAAGRRAGELADLVIGVGMPAREYSPQHWFETNDELVQALPQLLRPGDVVLVKGSHSARLDRVVKRLAAPLDTSVMAPR